MAIQDLSSIKQAYNVVSNLSGENLSSAKTQLQELFSQKFYNSGSMTASALDAEIKKVEDFIKLQQTRIEEVYTKMRASDMQLKKYMDELNDEISKITTISKDNERRQKDTINKAQDEAFLAYSKGEIKKEEIPGVIAEKLMGSSLVNSSALVTHLANVDVVNSRVKTICNIIAEYIDQADSIKSTISTAKTTLNLLNVVKQSLPNLNPSGGVGETALGQKPHYTPAKQDFVDAMVAQYRTGQTTGDPAVWGNAQVQNLAQAINLGGNQNQSIIQQMKDNGFSYKEAAYALTWIFNFNPSYVNFNLNNNQLNVPYGHDAGSRNTFNEVINQFNSIYGKNNTLPEGSVQNPDGSVTLPDGSTGTPEPTPPIGKTDPIGFNKGDTTFEFVIDRNNDNIFNGKEEFLGSENGIQELFSLDKDGNGIIENSELESLMVLKTDHQVRGYSFLSASMAGITSIDLKSYENKTYTNINDNNLVGNFNINTNTGAAKGYQTLDDNGYINRAYGNAFGQNYTFQLNQNDLDSMNQDFGLESIKTSKAYLAQSIEDATQEVVEVKQEVADNNLKLKQELNEAKANS